MSKKKLWNSQQKKLRQILKPKYFEEAIDLCLEQHAMVHLSEMSQINKTTLEDELWEGIDETTFKSVTNNKGRTVAYGLWHSSRIEDICSNILITNEQQVINTNDWLNRINSSICDTGNAMSEKEILEFSKDINIEALRDYRIAVGRKTREILQTLKASDLKKEIEQKRLERVLNEGAVLNVESANWLIEYWGKRNFAGILLMPITRHHLVHLNESIRAKNKSKSC